MASRPRRARGTRTTTEAGYGYQHQQARKAWAPLVAEGTVTCWRCGQPIHPLAEWHLGHDDWDRTIIRGPEHARECNLSAAARKRNHPTQPPTVPITRPW